MMCCRFTVGRPFSDILENLLQFPCARNNNSNLYRAQIEKQAEVVQVSVEEWILVIPFHFNRDAALKTVNCVSWTVNLVPVDDDGSLEFLLDPAFRIKRLVDPAADQ